MSKQEKFKFSYLITFEGKSRKSDWNKYTFMEEFIDTTLAGFVSAMRLHFKSLRIKKTKSIPE